VIIQHNRQSLGIIDLTDLNITKIKFYFYLPLFMILISIPTLLFSKSVDKSLRPKPYIQVSSQVNKNNVGLAFEAWILSFKETALEKGISATLYDKAMKNITYNEKLIKLDRKQSEFTKQIWEYLEIAVSNQRIKNGQSAYLKNVDLLNKIQNHYDVDLKIILGIWGLESAYGFRRGSTNTIEALATLAFDGRRRKFFEEQLIASLRILERGDTTLNKMQGSWAGAMGHTQFIPTSYLAYAEDFNGDGLVEVWSDDPTDALASTANYLNQHGWIKGQPWGLEIILPNDFDYILLGKENKNKVSYWNSLGVRQVNGNYVKDYGNSSIILPAGHRGAAFVIFSNFHVLEKYNASLAYVMGVGHLGDRIMGGRKFHKSWPIDENALSSNEKKMLQRYLLEDGYEIGKIDGMIGPKTISAIRVYQRKLGKIPDGFATKSLLKEMQ
jgi:membrane-bound lytic murein transglycosylase B